MKQSPSGPFVHLDTVIMHSDYRALTQEVQHNEVQT